MLVINAFDTKRGFGWTTVLVCEDGPRFETIEVTYASIPSNGYQRDVVALTSEDAYPLIGLNIEPNGKGLPEHVCIIAPLNGKNNFDLTYRGEPILYIGGRSMIGASLRWEEFHSHKCNPMLQDAINRLNEDSSLEVNEWEDDAIDNALLGPEVIARIRSGKPVFSDDDC